MPEKKAGTAILPKFATEAEDAKWWYENRERIEERLRGAMQDGTLRRGTAERLVRETREEHRGPSAD